MLTLAVRSADLTALFEVAVQVSAITFAASTALLLSLAAVQAARWGIVLKAIVNRFRHRVLLAWVLIGLFFSQLLPSSIGGDVMRVWKLHQAGTPAGKAFNSVFLDRITALLAAVIITSGGVLLTDLSSIPTVLYVTAGTLCAVICGYLVVFLSRETPGPLRRFTRFLGSHASAFADAMAGDLIIVLLNPRVIVPTLALSCLIHFGASTAVWMIARDAGADITLATCTVLVPLVVLVSMLPISIAGWGVREGAMVVAMGAVGVDTSIALATSLLFGLALALTGLPGALVWLYSRKSGDVRP
jgi:uncharacterized protein (TIRG00374 family)